MEERGAAATDNYMYSLPSLGEKNLLLVLEEVEGVQDVSPQSHFAPDTSVPKSDTSAPALVHERPIHMS